MKKPDVRRIARQLRKRAKANYRQADKLFKSGGSNDEDWQRSHQLFGKVEGLLEAAEALEALCNKKTPPRGHQGEA